MKALVPSRLLETYQVVWRMYGKCKTVHKEFHSKDCGGRVPGTSHRTLLRV